MEKECKECRKRKAKACQQIMAPLPLSGLKSSMRTFTRISVDFGGSFITVKRRGKRREKQYLCLFTCMATRAVHLEIASGLDTDSFLNAFYRMASRGGIPEEMFSDNGTNFKSADKELRSLVSELDDDKIQGSSTLQSTISSTFWRSTRIYDQIGETSYQRNIGKHRHQRQRVNESYNRGRGSD